MSFIPIYLIRLKAKGRIPSIWKDANISALYKNKGDKSETTNYRPVSLNYRPVSLTCLPSRICERTVRDTLMNHMYKNKLFTRLSVWVSTLKKLHSSAVGCFG